MKDLKAPTGKSAENGALDRFVNPWADCWGSGDCPPQENETASERISNMPSTDATDDDIPCDEMETSAEVQGENGTIVRILPIINNKGLHARASAKFVQTVEKFDADIKVSRCGETVGGLSIMGLMMLAAARGTTITVEASGVEAQEAMEAVEALLASRFGEEC